MRLHADGLLGGSLTEGWRGLAIVGGVALIALVSLLGAWLAARQRAEERRRLEVPPFSASEFQRFADHQQWITQQVAPPPGQPGRPTPPPG
jgi:hypothetical protein